MKLRLHLDCLQPHLNPRSLLAMNMDFKQRCQDVLQELISHRRALHRIPEPGLQEFKTAAYISEELSKLDLAVQTGVAGTGVTGLLRTGLSGPTVMLRSDMDGLSITEETGLDFASEHEGMMHACGHDGHMAMLLGAARVLSELRDNLCGNVLFVFQPAEEGPGGARPMIEAGVLDDPRVDCALGMHLWPDLPKGRLGVREGPLMAAMDRFELDIFGQTGHGAMPHLCVDALDTGVQVVNALQRLVSRMSDPLEPVVLTVGTFQSGSTFNVIPGRAELSGTTRAFDRAIWESWEERMRRVIEGVCRSMGADYALNFIPGFPPLTNHPDITKVVRRAGEETVGSRNVVIPKPTMGGEDMAFFLERVKGCYVFLGVGEDGGAPVHNHHFDFDESVLAIGTELFCRGAADLLIQP
jgi:amidohydrolase